MLAYVSTVEDPTRFRTIAIGGAHLGLTPRRDQSGEIDRSGRILRCGDGLARILMYEAAVVILTRVKRASHLKGPDRIAGKRGRGSALPHSGRRRVRRQAAVCIEIVIGDIVIRASGG